MSRTYVCTRIGLGTQSSLPEQPMGGKQIQLLHKTQAHSETP